jgi:hypothetical protein
MTILVPPAVRILPMSQYDTAFCGEGPKQNPSDFFLADLPFRDPPGEYRYASHGLDAVPGTVTLFQFQNHIVASATFLRQETFPEPVDDCHGALYFDEYSIRVFDPVGADTLKQVWPDFKGFGQVKWSLAPNQYPALIQLLQNIRLPEHLVRSPDEVDPHSSHHEGSVKKVLVNAYERNPKARSRCIEHYKPICVICGFDFGTVYGKDAAGFIHVHHLIPLSEIRSDYEVDPIRDLRPVCPNCHAVIHLRGGCRGLEEVKAMLE